MSGMFIRTCRIWKEPAWLRLHFRMQLWWDLSFHNQMILKVFLYLAPHLISRSSSWKHYVVCFWANDVFASSCWVSDETKIEFDTDYPDVEGLHHSGGRNIILLALTLCYRARQGKVYFCNSHKIIFPSLRNGSEDVTLLKRLWGKNDCSYLN